MSKKLAAEYLSMSERQLDRLREKNEISAYGKPGDAVKFELAELDGYIDRLPER